MNCVYKWSILFKFDKIKRWHLKIAFYKKELIVLVWKYPVLYDKASKESHRKMWERVREQCFLDSDMVKHELRVEILKARVQIQKLRVQLYELPAQIHELRV